MEDFWQWAGLVVMLGCVLPFIVMVVLTIWAVVFGKRVVENWLEPDVPKLQAQMVDLKQRHPDWDNDQLIAAVVRRQALKCGAVGALTGFGGFATLPIALPVDLVLTARFQASMVGFIAQVHGYEESFENKAATYAVMSGSTELSKVTTAAVRKYAPRFIGKSLSKLIPFVGALIAFIVNYTMARSTASAAIYWYRSKTRDQLLGGYQQLKLA